MKSKLSLVACIVVLLGGLIWTADQYLTIQKQLYTARLRGMQYGILLPEYEDLKYRHQNMRRYLKNVKGASDTSLVIMEAYQK